MNYRFKAIEKSEEHKPKIFNVPKDLSYYGSLTFTLNELPTELRNRLEKSLDDDEKKITMNLANEIAEQVKRWALENQVTHFTHWFNPLNGQTAEKHDSFIEGDNGGEPVINFSGKDLIQQEPDASSFPSGGIRNTFEARGYSAWDPTSPFFIIDDTLCIPCVFVSYTGESLDYKSPLLKTIKLLNDAATDVCSYFHTNINKVFVTLGVEQEYFLVDSSLYNARPDLVLAGRTVFGHSSAKDQQLSDHYFGVIPERAIQFMKELEYEAHRLGIPLKTRHNEVAPNQFECAPLFEEVNVAIDHNQLLMTLMTKVAKRHNLNVILHEKPFANINGSGKHNNWSLVTDTGINLLSPGKTEKENLRFLVFLVNTIKAVNDYNDLLRASISSVSNDLRLGGHEAPPAIISVFIGKKLTEILRDLKFDDTQSVNEAGDKDKLILNIPKIPEILLDNTDRNRTSPFAFTGNKFEFRAVGSSSNCASPMIALNLMVANQLKKFKSEVDYLTMNDMNKNDAILRVLKNTVMKSTNILFEGNNYSEEWLKEAKKRKLPNIKTTDEALNVFTEPHIVELFEKNNILTQRELEARRDIRHEQYVMKLQIEGRLIGDLATNHIVPISIEYQNRLYRNYEYSKNLGFENKLIFDMINEISKHIQEIKKGVDLMTEARKNSNIIDNIQEKAESYRKNVLPYFEAIRYHVDKLELMVDDELWTLPKYRELLFL